MAQKQIQVEKQTAPSKSKELSEEENQAEYAGEKDLQQHGGTAQERAEALDEKTDELMDEIDDLLNENEAELERLRTNEAFRRRGAISVGLEFIPSTMLPNARKSISRTRLS